MKLNNYLLEKYEEEVNDQIYLDLLESLFETICEDFDIFVDEDATLGDVFESLKEYDFSSLPQYIALVEVQTAAQKRAARKQARKVSKKVKPKAPDKTPAKKAKVEPKKKDAPKPKVEPKAKETPKPTEPKTTPQPKGASDTDKLEKISKIKAKVKDEIQSIKKKITSVVDDPEKRRELEVTHKKYQAENAKLSAEQKDIKKADDANDAKKIAKARQESYVNYEKFAKIKKEISNLKEDGEDQLDKAELEKKAKEALLASKLADLDRLKLELDNSSVEGKQSAKEAYDNLKAEIEKLKQEETPAEEPEVKNPEGTTGPTGATSSSEREPEGTTAIDGTTGPTGSTTSTEKEPEGTTGPTGATATDDTADDINAEEEEDSDEEELKNIKKSNEKTKEKLEQAKSNLSNADKKLNRLRKEKANLDPKEDAAEIRALEKEISDAATAKRKAQVEVDDVKDNFKSEDTDMTDEEKLEAFREQVEIATDSYVSQLKDIDSAVENQKDATNELVGGLLGKANFFSWLYISKQRAKNRVEFLTQLATLIPSDKKKKALKGQLDKAIEMMKDLEKKSDEAEKQGEASAKKTDPEKLEKATSESPKEAPEEEQTETIEEFKLRTATEKYDAIKTGLDSKKEELKNETDEAKKEILQTEVDKIQANLDIAKAAIDKYKETAEEGNSTDLWTISAILSLAEERLNNLWNEYPING
jgi:myosin heavy subunit